MARNRFEQVEEQRTDAVTLNLWAIEGRALGSVEGPVSLDGGRLEMLIDLGDGPASAVQAFGEAIQMANSLHVALVVIDRDGVWQTDWGDLYRPGSNSN
jgi:hypothetical protein